MLLERGLKTDRQEDAAVGLLKNGKSFDSVLAKGSFHERINGGERLTMASAEEESLEKATLQVEW
jgi:hypothetical protein